MCVSSVGLRDNLHQDCADKLSTLTLTLHIDTPCSALQVLSDAFFPMQALEILIRGAVNLLTYQLREL